MRHTHDSGSGKRWRFSYAGVAATVALVMAMGGTAYALVVTSADIQDGTIQSQDLHKNAVTSSRIKKAAVRSSDVKNGSLKGADVRDGSLTGADVQDASLGSADIQNGSLTGADIQNGSIGTADLSDAARQDQRVHTFSVVGATDYTYPTTELVVISTTGFTFKAGCDGDSPKFWLQSSLDGVNYVRTQLTSEIISGSYPYQANAFFGVNHDSLVSMYLANGGAGGDGGSGILSGIAPKQPDGSTPGVLVEVTGTGITGGCTLTGTVTDTTTYP